MQPIAKTLSFNDKSIIIRGSVEEPLFHCKQVLIHLLGYIKLNNKFYLDNINNTRYIMVINNDHYFTELGIYRCLFTCNKPIVADL